MKKLIAKLNMAVIGVMVSVSAFAAPAGANLSGVCKLMDQMHGVFEILRTLAFVGAAFTIAGWAWGYISKGEVKMDDLQKKGTGMLVGFVLLFGIGIVLQFLVSSAGADALGCPVLENW